ncbi:MAG TPA: sulfotransferase, partial [Sphingomonadales bacterium]|nr:sulfotransferase [Sphingomonadales bacterium]
RLFPGDPYLHLTLARCERRAGKIAEARARLENILEHAREPALRAQILYQLGWLYDSAGEFAKAFAAYAEAKRLSSENARQAAFDPDVPLTLINKAAALDLGQLPRVSAPKDARGRARDVAFLVGFPRSGTTLLHQVLDSHPGLVALEEKPVLPLTALRLAEWDLRYPEDLPALSSLQVEELREDYFRLAHEYAAFHADSILIDKLPLNLTHLPFILTLFPSAKIILALRHPWACVLSCFMHDFRLNNAMVHMVSLESIVALYVKVMGLWRGFTAKRAFAAHAVRYEDVVADLAGEARKICAFLDVPFSPEMLKYDQHARAKGLINTPSYHQVVRPVYPDAVMRWRHYEKHLAPYAGALAPFTEAFGYTA